MSSYPPQQPPQQPPPYGQPPPQQPPPYSSQPPPSYGMPPYGQQQPPYPPQGPYAEPKTNGLAIGGFIVAFFFGLIGLVLSIIALNQINASNGMQKGKGLALAGIIISALNMVGGIFLFRR
jgi:hypothetical protein